MPPCSPFGRPWDPNELTFLEQAIQDIILQRTIYGSHNQARTTISLQSRRTNPPVEMPSCSMDHAFQ